MDLTGIYKPIKKDIEKVEEELKDQLRVHDQFVSPLKNYILKNRGKLIRPALMLLSVKGVEPTTQKLSNTAKDCLLLAVDSSVISIASAIELIHTASLLHDDVLDREKIRRKQPTVNDKWGNKTAVLFGDYLYSMAISIVTDYQEIAAILSNVVLEMSEGEIIHNLRKNDLNMAEEEYMRIITNKSALLFGASCRIGAILAGANSEQQESLYQYGINFGIAYQILDDLLDIESDLARGKITLPLIYLIDSRDDWYRYSSRVEMEKVLNRVCQKINEHLGKAKESLKIVRNSSYKRSLEKLLQKFKAISQDKRGFPKIAQGKLYSYSLSKKFHQQSNRKKGRRIISKKKETPGELDLNWNV